MLLYSSQVEEEPTCYSIHRRWKRSQHATLFISGGRGANILLCSSQVQADMLLSSLPLSCRAVRALRERLRYKTPAPSSSDLLGEKERKRSD